MNRLTLISDYLKRPGAEDELLNAVVPRTHLADDSFYDFGLPSAFEERKRLKRERLYRLCFWPLMVFVIFAIGFYVGINIG